MLIDMTPKEFFDKQLITDSNCVVDKYSHKFTRHDMFKFAGAYGMSQYMDGYNKGRMEGMMNPNSNL
jgi:hypothetical protein